MKSEEFKYWVSGIREDVREFFPIRWRWPYRVMTRSGRCGEMTGSPHHSLPHSMQCLRRKDHLLIKHRNQWNEMW